MLRLLLALSCIGAMVLALPSAHVVVFVSPGGWATTASDIMTPTRYWRNMLASRNLPFNVTIEMIDANPINTFDLTKFVAISQPIIKARLTNMSLPRATGWSLLLIVQLFWVLILRPAKKPAETFQRI